MNGTRGAGLALVLFAGLAASPRSSHAEAASILQPRPVGGESYGETFTAFADLDDGTYVLLQLLFTNAGLGDENAVCRVLVVPPGKKGQNEALKVSRSGWRFDPAERALHVGDCRLAASRESTEFRAVTSGLSVVLEVEAGLHPIAPPDARIRVREKFQESEILIAAARASAAISGAGLAERRASGKVQLDHTRGDAVLKDLAARWIRFRGLSGRERLSLQVRFPPEGRAPEGWIWHGDEPAPTRLAPGALTLTYPDGRPRLELETPRGPLVLETLEPLFEYRPVEQYGFLGKLARPWIGNPINTTYRARVRGAGTSTSGVDVRGTLEHQDLTE